MHTLTTCAALARITEPDAESAWATLVDRHGPDVWRLIASRQWDIHVAEDAYQEFWLALPQAARHFRPAGADSERAAQAWLLAVAYRTSIDVHRRRRPAQAMTQEVPSTTENDMAEQDERAHQLARVEQALEAMPESQRQPVLLHLVGGLSYEELAAELRCTVNNARVKVHRGLAKLREQLGVDAAELPERTLAGLLVPPLLMLPPPAPALAVAVAAPAAPVGFFAAASKGPLFAAIAKAPVLVGISAAVAVTGVSAVVITARHVPPAQEATQESIMPDPRPIAIAALTAVAVSHAAGAVLDDFERSEPLMTSRQSPPRSILSIVPAPSGLGAGSALRIAWTAEHQNYVDCYYDQKMPAAPAFTPDGAGVATIKLWAEAYSGVSKIAIRFTDAKFETWQWGVALPNPGQTGWRTVSIPLIPAQNKGHWGPDGTVDGVIDFPLKLNGYAIEFTDAKAPAGAVVIDDVAVTTATTTP